MRRYWNSIRNKYKKAYDELCKDHFTIDAWGHIDTPDIWGEFVDEDQYVLRHLYDFFDSRGINAWCYTQNGQEWHYGILRDGRYLSTSEIKYESREKAELDAWEKAFEILDKK